MAGYKNLQNSVDNMDESGRTLATGMNVTSSQILP